MLKEITAHIIKNNENFPITAEIELFSCSTGLTVELYDGTMTTTTSIDIPANSNKWLIVHYITDNTVSNGDSLTSVIDIDITPS